MTKVWVCQVRREAFVGGESQRCRHADEGCGVMELIGGEPIEWCIVHGSPYADDDDDNRRMCSVSETFPTERDPCRFESQIRVGP